MYISRVRSYGTSTEHGAIIAAPVLNSHRAVEMSRYRVRPFVRLRQLSRNPDSPRECIFA